MPAFRCSPLLSVFVTRHHCGDAAVSYGHAALRCLLSAFPECSQLYTWQAGRSQWPRGLRRRYSAARLLGLWVRIPLGAWMFVSCECLSLRGLCDGPISRPEESYRVWCVWLWSWSLGNEETVAHEEGGGVSSVFEARVYIEVGSNVHFRNCIFSIFRIGTCLPKTSTPTD